MTTEALKTSSKSNRFTLVIILILTVIVLVLSGGYLYLRSVETTLYTDAQMAYEQDDFAQAITLFDQARAVEPSFVRQHEDEVLRGRALANLYAENYQAAIDDLTAVLTSNPNQTELLLARAEAYQGVGDFAAAITDYSTLLATDPTNVDLLQARANMYSAAGNESNAAADYEVIMAQDSTLLAPHLAQLNQAVADDDTDAIITTAETIIALDDTVAEPYLRRGQTYLTYRRDAEALADFEQVLALEPDNQDAIIGQALIYLLNEQDVAALQAITPLIETTSSPVAEAIYGAGLMGSGDVESGLEILNTAVSTTPDADLPLTLTLRGLAHLRNGQTAAALSDAEQSIDLSPEWAWGHLLRGDGHLDRGELPQAQIAYQQAIDLIPDFGPAYAGRATTYLAAEDLAAARADLLQALTLAPDYQPALLLQAEVTFVDESYEQTLTEIEKVLAANPDLTKAYAIRAAAYTQLEEWQAAAEDYAYVLTANPNDLAALGGRAQAKMALGEDAETLLDLNRAITLDPRNIDLINQRIQAYLALEDMDAALRDANRANALDSNLPFPYYVFGLNELEQENYFQAVIELTEAINLDAEMAAAFAARGRAHFLLDDPDRAWADAARALELDSELAEGYLVRALVHGFNLEWRDALTNIEKATTLRPDDALMRQTQGLIYLESGDANAALDEFDAMLTLNPESIDGHLLQATAFDQLNRYDDALVALQTALELAASADAESYTVADVELAESTIADLNRIPPEIDGMRTWQDVYQGFSISYPASWRQFVEPGADAPLAILGPLDKDYRANISLFLLDFDFVPSASELARYMNPDANQFDDFEMLSDTAVRVDGRSAIRRVFTWTASDQRLRDVSFTIIQHYVVDGERALVFTAFARSEDFEKYETIFNDMLQSVTFE